MKRTGLQARTGIISVLCALAALALVVLQFIPYWHFGEGASASVNGYIWMPSDHSDLTKYFEEALDEKVDINNEIGTPILMLVLGVATIGLCCWKPKGPLPSLCGAAQGLTGVIGYLRSPVLRLGSLWGLQLGLSVAVLVLGAAGIVLLLLGREKGGAASARR